MSRCRRVPLPPPAPPPLFSFLSGILVLLLHARESNHRAAQGKRNFRRNKLRGNTKNGHFADVAPPALLLLKALALSPCAPFHRSFPSKRNRVCPRWSDRAALLWPGGGRALIINFTMIQRAFRLAWAGPGFNTFSTRSRLAPCYLSGPTTVIFSPMHAVSPHGKKEFRKPRRRDVPTNYFLLFFFFPLPPFFFSFPSPALSSRFPPNWSPHYKETGIIYAWNFW